MEFENAAQMQQICNEWFVGQAERPVITQGQDSLCQSFIHSLTDTTFHKKAGTPLQALTHFLYQTLDIRNSRNPEEPLLEKSLGTKLYKIAQELKEQSEDPFFENTAKPVQKR